MYCYDFFVTAESIVIRIYKPDYASKSSPTNPYISLALGIYQTSFYFTNTLIFFTFHLTTDDYKFLALFSIFNF